MSQKSSVQFTPSNVPQLLTADTMLRNTAYVGEHYFNRNDSRRGKQRPREEWVAFPMPRIVDDALFYAAQEKLDRQHPLKTPPRLVRSEVLLTAVARCGECGAALRKLSGKSRAYHYYRCSKKFESGAEACKGVSIAMGELDDIVLGALEETVLEPKRLRKMTGALVSRAIERNEALAARQKQLDGERRKAKAQVAELYRLLGTGELQMDATLAPMSKRCKRKSRRSPASSPISTASGAFQSRGSAPKRSKASAGPSRQRSGTPTTVPSLGPMSRPLSAT